MRVYSLQAQLPRITVSSYEDNPTYTITATEVTNYSVYSNLTIYEAANNHYDISNTYMGKPFNSTLSYEYSFIDNTLSIELPTYMFSG